MILKILAISFFALLVGAFFEGAQADQTFLCDDGKLLQVKSADIERLRRENPCVAKYLGDAPATMTIKTPLADAALSNATPSDAAPSNATPSDAAASDARASGAMARTAPQAKAAPPAAASEAAVVEAADKPNAKTISKAAKANPPQPQVPGKEIEAMGKEAMRLKTTEPVVMIKPQGGGQSVRLLNAFSIN